MWSNDVYVCRHGESEANVLELIVSGSEGLFKMCTVKPWIRS